MENCNSHEIKQFINDRKELFWYIRDDRKADIPLPLLVETILIYGDVADIRNLVGILGKEKVAGIFYHQIELPRHNYPERTVNYFKVLFREDAFRGIV